jgi:hypothetical protein
MFYSGPIFSFKGLWIWEYGTLKLVAIVLIHGMVKWNIIASLSAISHYS